jgi:protein-disulfide isomerase
MKRHYSLFIFALLPLLGCQQGVSKEELAELSNEVVSLKSKISKIREVNASLGRELHNLKRIIASSNLVSSAISFVSFYPGKEHLNDPFLGDKGSSSLVMVFTDYQCKTCKKFADTSFQQLKKDFVDNDSIQLILRDFPLQSHKQGFVAAKLAQCGGEQGKYWQMHDKLFANQDRIMSGSFPNLIEGLDLNSEKLTKCYESSRYDKEVQGDISEAKQLGVKGVPSIFVGKKDSKGVYDGILIRGAQPYPFIKSEIQKVIKRD